MPAESRRNWIVWTTLGFLAFAGWLVITVLGPFHGGGPGGGLIGVIGFWPGRFGEDLEMTLYWLVFAAVHLMALAALRTFAGPSVSSEELARPRMRWPARVAAALLLALMTMALIAALDPGWYHHFIRGPKLRRYPYLLCWPVPSLIALGLLWTLYAGLAGFFRGHSSLSQRYWIARLLFFASSVAAGVGWLRMPLDLNMRNAYYPAAPWWQMGFNTALVLGLGGMAWSAFAMMLILPRRRQVDEMTRGTCFKCGYDLRETLAAGRRACPECGQAIGTSQLHAGGKRNALE